MVCSIPIDFCIEFWNSIFSPVLEYTEGIFLTASARAFSKVIQVFLAANSTWTYYSFFVIGSLVSVHSITLNMEMHGI